MKKTVKLHQLLEFETCFPDEEVLSPIEYLKGCDKSLILKLAAIFNTIDVRNEKENDCKEIFEKIFCHQNRDFKHYILAKIEELERHSKIKVLVFNPYSNIKLFEYFFNQPEGKEIQNAVEFERNFIKAYLAINSQNTKNDEISSEVIKKLPLNMQTAMSLLCILFPKSDKVNYNKNELWISEILKAIYLFKFLEENPTTKELLERFLSYYNKNTWKEYLSTILSLTKPAILDADNSLISIEIPKNENFSSQCDFIDKLTVDYKDEFEEYDFVTTRSKPLYKIENGKYIIIYKLFLIEKIFTGLYFSLREINKTLDKEKKIANWRSFYCKEFSEKTLTYQVVESIYPTAPVRLSGQQLEKLKIDGAPDYYIRKGKNVLVFESKDFLITSEVKASSDYEAYVKEFSKSLYAKKTNNGKEKNGAVLQLKEFIKRILSNEFTLEKYYEYDDCNIYPIIITHHRDHDTNGLNVLINEWFIKELVELKNITNLIITIRPITIINIDTMIFFKEVLLKNISLHELIDNYFLFINQKPPKSFRSEEELQDYYTRKSISFASFTDIYLRENNIYQPPVWKDHVIDELN